MVLLYACLNGDCTVMFFRNREGRCASCGEAGYRVAYALKPPRYMPPPDD